MLFAGHVAEKELSGRNNHLGARDDYERAVAYAMAASGSNEESDAFLAWLHVRTHQLITHHWPEVEAVAAALLREKTLSGRRVCEIIQQSRARE